MDAGDLDNSITGGDDTHCYHVGQNPEAGSINGALRPFSEDSHERYHKRHLEALERTTDTAAEDDADWTSSPVGRRGRPVVDTHLTKILLEMQAKIQALEAQLKPAPGNTSLVNGVANGTSVGQLFSDATAHEQRPRVDVKPVEMIAVLHETSWKGFMNKAEDDKREYAIEVLIGEPDYQHTSGSPQDSHEAAKESNGLAPESMQETNRLTPLPVEELVDIPDRIRINSSHILNCLATLDKTVDPSAPLIMLAPFKLLIHFEDKIRDLVHRLQDLSSGLDTQNFLDDPIDTQQMQAYPALPNNRRDRKMAAQHMQCLIDFIDQYLRPTVERLQNTSGGKISFKDLWYIFHPGVDIFMPVTDRQRNVSLDPMKLTPEMFQNRYERMWRVIGTGSGRKDISAAQNRETRIRQNPFKIKCYYIDFDGTYFGPTIHTFSIQPYSGEREITSLELFPLRFLRKSEKFRNQSLTQGRLVFDALMQSHTHFYYSGPTLTTQPCGCRMQNEHAHQEHVESEVIIDYRAALQKHPSWRPETSPWKGPPVSPGEVSKKFRVRYWNDKSRSKLIRTEIDNVYDDNVIDKERALIFKESEEIFDPIPSGWLSNEKSVPEEDVAMLSGRIFAFVLRTRTFAPIWLWGLQKISAQTEGLHNLQLRDNSFKNTIHALVRTHFLQKTAYRNAEFEYDLVRGKGKGLVFLLHGAPGVGKTFTAESVAAANGRPLFQITCGDLGLTPSEVEKALKEIFRFAQLWDCVLLLDECDIFLTQRTKNDLKRNSLVSVFLRVLEFYTGVLFLTTNRVGTLDSAVKSRITWSTYYPPLDMKQTREIWKTNLNLLERRYPNIEVDKKGILKFAKDHFYSSIKQGTNWNGRQIQNAFKVAVSLAGWASYSNDEQQAMDTRITKDKTAPKMRITAENFQTVAIAAETFDDYLREATGLTEAQRAYNAQERADDYGDEEEVLDDSGSGLRQEPPVRNRQSSSASAMHLQTPVGKPRTAQGGPGSRRSSNVQQNAPQLSRKTSGPQSGISFAGNWQSGFGQNKNNQKSGTTPSDPIVHPPSPYDGVPNNKRRRTGSGHQPAPQYLKPGPNQQGDIHDTSEDSDYAVSDVVGIGFPEEEDEDWAD